MDISVIIDSCSLVFVILDTQNEGKIREKFLHLQKWDDAQGAGKKKCCAGSMRGFIKRLANREFFTKLYFPNTRFTYDLIAPK